MDYSVKLELLNSVEKSHESISSFELSIITEIDPEPTFKIVLVGNSVVDVVQVISAGERVTVSGWDNDTVSDTVHKGSVSWFAEIGQSGFFVGG